MKLRINRLLSDAGLGSRREVEELIRQGRIKLNGQRATLTSIVEASDEVLFDDVDLPVRDLVKEHEALEKVARFVREKNDDKIARSRKGRRTERAESQRISASPKSASLRKSSKNNPENKRLHKLRELEQFDDDENYSFARQPKGIKREYTRHSGPRKNLIRRER